MVGRICHSNGQNTCIQQPYTDPEPLAELACASLLWLAYQKARSGYQRSAFRPTAYTELDETGTFQKCLNDCVEVTHFPDKDDIWDCKKCGYSSAGRALLFVQQLIPVDNVVPDQIHIDSVRPCRILAATAGYVVPSLELPIYLGLNLLGGHLFRWDVFRHSHSPTDPSDPHYEGMLCCDCQYCGDKYSFSEPNDLLYMDPENPMLKHFYCCCGDCDLYGKDVTATGR